MRQARALPAGAEWQRDELMSCSPGVEVQRSVSRSPQSSQGDGPVRPVDEAVTERDVGPPTPLCSLLCELCSSCLCHRHTVSDHRATPTRVRRAGDLPLNSPTYPLHAWLRRATLAHQPTDAVHCPTIPDPPRDVSPGPVATPIVPPSVLRSFLRCLIAALVGVYSVELTIVTIASPGSSHLSNVS